MKTCMQCGANLPDEANVCAACGMTQPMMTAPVAPVAQEQPQPVSYPGPGYQPQEEPVSVGGWIGRNLIPLIPFVGSLIFLVMLFIWSGDRTKQATFRNWAKAQLILMAIGVVLGIILVVGIVAIVGALGANVADMA